MKFYFFPCTNLLAVPKLCENSFRCGVSKSERFSQSVCQSLEGFGQFSRGIGEETDDAVFRVFQKLIQTIHIIKLFRQSATNYGCWSEMKVLPLELGPACFFM